MTTKRRDNHSTEFGLWLRDQTEIDSKLGYLATNIDYVWYNYKNKKWMLIEEKRYGYKPKSWQRNVFKAVHCSIESKDYYGFHLLVFENTCPDDGKIWLDNKEISKDELIIFLKDFIKS